MESKTRKSNIICNWKKTGVIYNDFDELYYIYIRTLNCSHCNKEFKNSLDRCLDHDHSTGLFRAIVCRGCNIHDRYINYPEGYDNKLYYKKNKEKIAKKKKEYGEVNKERIAEAGKIYREKNKEIIKEKKNKKITCECGGKYTNCHKSIHLKTMKHTDWYMEQVD